MPRITPIAAPSRIARPVFDDDPDSYGFPRPEPEEEQSPDSYSRAQVLENKRIQRYTDQATKRFKRRPFVWPVPEAQCINGYTITAPWKESGASVQAGTYVYTPVRVGCGSAGTDCAYCVADRSELARRMSRLNANGVAPGHAFLALETKLGRRLSSQEFLYLVNRVGIGVNAEALELGLKQAETNARNYHETEEASRLRRDISNLRAEGDRSIQEKRNRIANMRKKERALSSAMRTDPAPVDVNDRDIRDGVYQRRSPVHGVPFLASRGFKRSHRMVGIEVEYNQTADLSAWIKRWNGAVHTDGSCGWEAVTTPIAGDRILPCMVQLTDTLKNLHVQADSRCSVHVHVDASDVTWACMRRLLHVYALVEPLLYAIGGQHRAQSRYAAPCGEAYSEAAKCDDFKEAVLWVAMAGASRGQHGRELARQRPGKKDGGRYRGLNIMPWAAGRRTMAPDTTIEFRIHRNCLDGKRIAGWASLLASLVDFAVNSSDSEVSKLPKSALRTLILACPEDKAWILQRVKSWRSATTAIRTGEVTDDAGTVVPRRRISARKGWSLCVD
jgi:hypothetical protein